MFYCNTAAFAVCPDSKQAGRLLEDHCKSSDQPSALGPAYKRFNDALTQIKVNSEIMEMMAGFDLFAKKWTWWLRIVISSEKSCIGTSFTVDCHD